MTANDNEDVNRPFSADLLTGNTPKDYEDVAAIFEWNANNYPGLSDNPVWNSLVERFHADWTAARDRQAAWEAELAGMDDPA